MTHFFAGFLVAPEGAWLLWRGRDRITLLACAVVAAVQLAMLPLAAADTGHGTGWVAPVPPLRRISRTVMEWGVSILERRGRFAEGLLGGVVAVLVVALLVLASPERRRRRGVAVAAVVGGIRVRGAAGPRRGGTGLLPVPQRDPGGGPRHDGARGRLRPVPRGAWWADWWPGSCWPASRSPRSTCRPIPACSGQTGGGSPLRSDRRPCPEPSWSPTAPPPTR